MRTSWTWPSPDPRSGSPRRVARGGRRLAVPRPGISLLEVTFSIGVVMIGLVGIAALIPLAGSQANRGAVADAAARTGANAIREFHVRSMANPNAWRWFDPANSRFRAVTPAELLVGNSFCMDPRDVAQGFVVNDHGMRNFFPHVGNIQMPRVTLTPTPSADSSVVLGRLAANRLFTAQDDLVFELPSDRTLGPVQNFSRATDNPNSAPLRRNVGGTISWKATLVPRLDRLGNPTDLYTLSIVVFARRVLDPNPVDLDNATERVVEVDVFYSASPAMGGGDVRLVTLRNEASDLQLRGGDWVMLSGRKIRFNPVTQQPAGTVDVHIWYRVIQAGEEPVFVASRDRWVRDVTLIGPDWDWGNLVDGTQVTIARGAAAVFEKTIRLETSSLWTN